MNRNDKDDKLHLAFSTEFFELRKIAHLVKGRADSHALPTGLGKGAFLKYSDGSVKYDLRPYPHGPGLFGHSHSLILKNTLRATKANRTTAHLEEVEELKEQLNQVLKQCDPHEKEILRAGLIPCGPLKRLSYQTYLCTKDLLRLIAEGPVLGPQGRIGEIESWLDEYKGRFKRKNLTVYLPPINEKELFSRGIHCLDQQLHFPLSLFRHHLKEIFQICHFSG